jgi:3-oxoacyl-[acyl-carrier protein] reductase
MHRTTQTQGIEGSSEHATKLECPKEEGMNLGIRGKTALVGGASRGLGFAVSRCLAEEGAHLILVARDEALLMDAKTSLPADERSRHIWAFPGDLGAKEDVERLLAFAQQKCGGVDILVHNTGGPPPGDFLDHDDGVWDAAYAGLLLSVVRVVRGLLPGMIERGWGRVILNTSFTVREPADRLILSNVFRTAVVALAKTLSRDVASDGVTVNCVCPGAFDTERLGSIFDEQAAAANRSRDEIANEWRERIPIGRFLRPEELGDLVAFLASNLAGGITGSTFPIEGGMLHGLF